MSSAALLKKYRPKSNRDPEIGSPSINIRGSVRCHPRGLPVSLSSGKKLERDLPNKEDGGLFNKLVCLSVALEIDFSPSTTLAVIIGGVGFSYLIASCKFFWPFKTFDQVGDVESEISLGLGL